MRLECVKRKPFSRARSHCVFSHDPLILWRGENHANTRMRCSVLYIAHFPTSYVHSLRGMSLQKGISLRKHGFEATCNFSVRMRGFPYIHVFCKKVAYSYNEGISLMMRDFPNDEGISLPLDSLRDILCHN